MVGWCVKLEAIEVNPNPNINWNNIRFRRLQSSTSSVMNFYDDDEERARRREQRKEYHIVSELCNKTIRFESVKQSDLNIRSRGLCFGNKTDRSVLPVKPSYFDPKFSLIGNEKLSQSEEISEKKNTTGSWNFVSVVPRFTSTDILQSSTSRYFPKEELTGKKIRAFNKYLSRTGINHQILETPG